MDGLVKAATVWPKGHPVATDKINFWYKNLNAFIWLGIVCICEIKWFGNDVHEVNGYMVLHSSCDIPQSGDNIHIQHGKELLLHWILSWRKLWEIQEGFSLPLV